MSWEWWGFVTFKDYCEVLLVPIVLAGIAFYASWITSRRQSERRDLNIKTDLVSEISKSVMSSVMDVHFLITQADNKSEEKFSEIKRNWLIGSCVIGSKLHAYFPEPKKVNCKEIEMRDRWDEFREDIENFITNTSSLEKKVDMEVFEVKKKKIFDQKYKIIKEILLSEITGFRH